jgi:glutathione S-transferase
MLPCFVTFATFAMAQTSTGKEDAAAAPAAPAAAGGGGGGGEPHEPHEWTSVDRLVLVDGVCCPFSAVLRLALVWKEVPFESIETEMGSKEAWLLRISADGTVPVLCTTRAADVDKATLQSLGLTAWLDMVRWVDAHGDEGNLFPPSGRAEHALTAAIAFGAAVAKVSMASAPPMQREWRAKAVEAAAALDAVLAGDAPPGFLSGSASPCAADAVAVAWLHRYPILVHARNWTPETKPGTRSELSPPAVADSQFPHLAAYRERMLTQEARHLPSAEALIRFAERRVPLLPPMSMGTLEHEVMRSVMKQPAISSTAAAWWPLFARLVEIHSVMEDSVVYPEFEVIEAASTLRAVEEHAHEVPRLFALADRVASAGREDPRLADDIREAFEALEAHMRGEEEVHMPIMAKLGPEVQKRIFPAAFAGRDASLVAFVVQHLSLSEAHQYLHNILTAGNLPPADIAHIYTALRDCLDRDRLDRIAARLPALTA